MAKQYNITDILDQIQQTLVSQSVANNSNMELLKSEDAIKEVLNSYNDKFKNIGNKLTEAINYTIEYRSKIDLEKLNDYFESINIDLQSLYNSLQLMDQISSLNNKRNKVFFKKAKQRLVDFRNRLYDLRLKIDDSYFFSESYLESFSTERKGSAYYNVDINKKTNILRLDPTYEIKQNESHLIKDIEVNTYPLISEGVTDLSSNLNSYSYNYSEQNRDMLEDGLWKKSIIVNDIPIIYTTTSNDSVINASGVVSEIIINYRKSVLINRLLLDLYGEYPYKIISVSYYDATTKKFIPIEFEPSVKSTQFPYNRKPFNVSGYDILDLMNLSQVSTSKFKIVLNQENFNILKNSNINFENVEQKINDDLSERRYELINTNDAYNHELSKPNSISDNSFEKNVNDIILSTKNISDAIEDVIDIFSPKPSLTNVNVDNTLSYEMGLWELAPILSNYHGYGIYKSGKYTLKDKSLINVKIDSIQNEPSGSSSNWYISTGDGDINIPIIENNSAKTTNNQYIRKEPANIINHNILDENLQEYTNGTLIQLDFPISLDQQMEFNIEIIINNEAYNIKDFETYYIFSSSLIYIDRVRPITNSINNGICIRYLPSVFNTYICYTIEKSVTKDIENNIEYSLFSPNKSILNKYLRLKKISPNYIIKPFFITYDEYMLLFPNYSYNLSYDNTKTLSNIPFNDNNEIFKLTNINVYGSDFENENSKNFINANKAPLIHKRSERNLNEILS